ncbi:efflux RND transporter permease subunit [Catenovulum maritimum]|uniref:RND transporter n=1 Tax=Catenovulum maritimum TaxID=1513271 RepID=A0A0J8JK15_9ALTE|nr:MMPL family transporter [Catenovulum maritimum]KMT64796.1 RND transporter [Catenovulum maritimum]
MNQFIDFLQKIIFRHRYLVLTKFLILTVFFAYQASQIKLDAGFTKNIPLQHSYMQTYLKYADEFGGANRVLISVCNQSGEIYQAEFFTQLKQIHDQLFFIEGVDRSQVTSLYSPSVRFTEIVEDGFAGGPVVSSDFDNSPASLQRVKRNVDKAGQVGKLVSNNSQCAMLTAVLLELNPISGQPIDPILIANKLEQDIRGKYQSDLYSIHIIGFAKIVGDVAAGAKDVAVFFAIAILITAGLVYLFCRSFRLMLFPILCSVIAMIWKIGILKTLGYGIDPMSILLPFLIFAIGVSHGVQMLNVINKQVHQGKSSKQAAEIGFKQLFLPGFIALVSDCIGFLTILSIDIGIIQELAIAASIGVGVVILTNLILLPVAISFLNIKTSDKAKLAIQQQDVWVEKIWQKLLCFCQPKVAVGIVIASFIIFGLGLKGAQELKIGDLHSGAPVLHEHSQYNQDTFSIVNHYEIGVDVLSVIAETKADGCTSFEIMNRIDQFQWLLSKHDSVQSSVSLASIAKIITSGYNEGNLKWRVIPQDSRSLAQSVSRVPTSSGLLNTDCSAMPIILFLKDHKAETIDSIIQLIETNQADYESDELKFKLASGPVGVMAATNQAVAQAQIPMMIYVYSAVFVLCLISFKSIKATIAVILPLFVVSTLAQALMAQFEIGLTVYTLPVIALGVGIGVDYGIYIVSSLAIYLRQGESLNNAFKSALIERGSAVIFTGLTLAIGVSTWFFSALKFQLDMGILLTFMFVVNMLAAIIVLPALCRLFWWRK